ncbi:MAG: YHS domain-containing protein [Ignavibacteriales bacterium]|nr:YHS domain-containing protein [Ignavibacteriales bacterium]
MKKLFVFVLALAVSGLLFTTTAQDKAVKKDAAKKETVKPAAAKTIFNKVCPVMEEDVDAKIQTVEYKGKTIGFCCKKCVKKFNADPEKYMKHISTDGQKYVD